MLGQPVARAAAGASASLGGRFGGCAASVAALLG